jgi:mono/diheme cytochrome c family protein
MTLGRKTVARRSLLAALICIGSVSLHAESPDQTVDFTRDVQPILASNCIKCHGPDAQNRQADLRLDVWSAGGDVLGAEGVIVAGQPANSELVSRITSDDPDLRMPPTDSGKTLKTEQIATLQKWIAQGAVYRKHWAFVAPERPPVPQVSDSARVRNPIDAFVLNRLAQENLSPSTQADAHTLLRRLSLDLIGLPPTLDEIAAFEANIKTDGLDGAYRREVERLLASPNFGERWARVWLDAARYADSDGFEKDKPRFVWMYRDWVINALNRDMPYNEFIVDQIAGDLLPNPTQDDLVATGFLRNSMINEEGGIDPEQFRMEAMYDRMDAIGKAILGLTVQCAQCHTHKYDPLAQTDYYRMFAFINNCHEAQISVYTPEETDQWNDTQAVIRRIEDGLRDANPDWRQRMAAWEASVRDDQPNWKVIRPDPDDETGQKYYPQDDGSILAAGYSPVNTTSEFAVDVKEPKISAIRLEFLNDPNLPHGGPGRSIYGTFALTEFWVDVAPTDKPTEWKNLKLASATADVNPPEDLLDPNFDDRSGHRRVTGPIDFARDGNNDTAWTVDIGGGRSNVPRKAVFVFEKPIEAADGLRLRFKLSQEHGGWNGNDNHSNNIGRFRFSISSADNPVADPLPADVRAILAIPAAERTPKQVDRVFSYWRTTVPEWREENRRIEALWQSHPRGTTQLVLQERKDRRITHRLERGNFLAPAEAVTPGVPDFLHPLTIAAGANAPPTRLDFARWLADRRSPTTARSIVNRIWQSYFGTGLVATAEDLGTQGDPPSHPQLLDWLSVELMDHNWSLKHLHRLIVTSATYQQSSTVTPELLARDPSNRLLARGPRFRVDAEVVRDIALSASGLLYNKVGGPSVHPPAPEFLFKPPASYGYKSWNVDTGPNRYRRALYTFRFRTAPYPMLQAFDAPNAEVACARRVRSNTPLQALTMLNEPLFVETARALALKVMCDGGDSETDRINYAVRRCLSREPHPKEFETLRRFLSTQKRRFSRSDAKPWTILVDNDNQKSEIERELPAGASPSDLAAWTALSRVVLSLDETITKE